MKENIKYLKLGTGDNRVQDEVSANDTAASLSEVFDSLKAAAENISETGPDFNVLQKLLSENATVVEVFFQISMILKGLHLLIEGEAWDKSVGSANHNFSQGVVDFLRAVHDENWNIPPPLPPKIINIE